MDCHHHVDQDKIHLHNGHNIRRICQDYILLLPIVLVDNSHSVYPITFKQSDDKCGSAADHAKELSNIIGQIKKETGQNKVNIIGHSKGGLDARVYLANNTNDVANLIMIGTPNAGSPLAELSNMGAPAVYDLRPGAAATEVKMNPNTKYYTIAGDWNPESENCQLTLFLSCEQSGFSSLPIPNDGMVSVSSVESRDYFIKSWTQQKLSF
jgi:pimeloyl-ACP methyl ester carboxylesterase